MQEIDKFLKTFGGQLDANDTAEPLESFDTFNQFFYRKLKPSARPIAEPSHGHVVVRRSKFCKINTSCAVCKHISAYILSSTNRSVQPCWCCHRRWEFALTHCHLWPQILPPCFSVSESTVINLIKGECMHRHADNCGCLTNTIHLHQIMHASPTMLPWPQVSACDARLTAFYGLSDATRCWIKGRHFSIAGLLADSSQDQQLSSRFDDGCMMIFRLAPQVRHTDRHASRQSLHVQAWAIICDLLQPLAAAAAAHIPMCCMVQGQ